MLDLTVASALTGLMSVGLGAPVDLVKIRLQMQTQTVLAGVCLSVSVCVCVCVNPSVPLCVCHCLFLSPFLFVLVCVSLSGLSNCNKKRFVGSVHIYKMIHYILYVASILRAEVTLQVVD